MNLLERNEMRLKYLRQVMDLPDGFSLNHILVILKSLQIILQILFLKRTQKGLTTALSVLQSVFHFCQSKLRTLEHILSKPVLSAIEVVGLHCAPRKFQLNSQELSLVPKQIHFLSCAFDAHGIFNDVLCPLEGEIEYSYDTGRFHIIVTINKQLEYVK